MKKLLIFSAIILGLGACSTTKEQTDKAQTDAQTKTEVMKDEAQKTVEEKATAMKKDAEDKKGQAMETAQKALKAACSLDKDTRIIEVKKTESGGCELFYTKFGEEKSVASSGFGTQYCEEVKDRIQTNLDKAGFSCQ